MKTILSCSGIAALAFCLSCGTPSNTDAPTTDPSTGGSTLETTSGGSTGSSSEDGLTSTDGSESTDGPASASCSVDGVSLALGESITLYDADVVRIDDTCPPHGQVRTCTEAGLDGDPNFEFANCVVSTDLRIHLEMRGDDTSDGLSPETPVRTLARAVEILDGFSDVATSAHLGIGPGRFEHEGELQLHHGVEIEGSGRDATVLAFSIDRDQPSMRLLSSDITIGGVEIEVDLIESLSDGVHFGGRGEYGTGITLGRYLHTEPHEVVDNVQIAGIRIRRTNFTAAGITIMGRSSNVTIDDVEYAGGRTSTAVIVHWGGHTTVAPAPAALEDPRYAVLTSYHPHGLTIQGIRAEDTARLAVVSSAYDVILRDFEGPTSAMLFVLPGDEIDRFASDEDAGRVMSNLEFSDFRAPLRADEGEHVVRITSIGTSRMDGERRLLLTHGLRLQNFEVQSVDRPGGMSYRYGINANDTRGSDIEFSNIRLADVGSWEYDDNGPVQASYGLYIRDALGISVDGLSTEARYGIGIIDSQDITIDDATLTYDGTPPSDANAFGVYVAESDAPEGANDNLQISNSTIEGYDYGVRYLDNPGGPETGCDTLVLDAVEYVGVGQETLCVQP